jgi:PAS domain S-box-containing protein
VREGFARFAEVLPDALLLTRRDGTLLAANSRAAALFGVSAAALAGARLTDLAEDPPEKVEGLLAAYARTRQAVPGALSLRHTDGTVRRCRCEGGVYRPPGDGGSSALILIRAVCVDESHDRFGRLTREIGELSREIGRRMRVEDELHQQREWLRVTLASIGDAVIATDAHHHITFINPAAAELTGWPKEEALGRPLTEVFRIVGEATRAPVENPVGEALRNGAMAGLARDTLLLRRDGGELPIDDSAAPIRHDDGRLLGAVLVFRDITEQRQLQRELEKRAQSLNELNRRKDEFLAMLSHELRNPLAPISNCLAVLDAQGIPDEGLQRLFAIMRRQVSQLTRLVDDLLDVSRITTGKIRLIRRRLALRPIAARALEALEPLLAGRNQQVTTAVEDLMVDGDEARLTQVVINLVENAAKYTPAGGHIALRARREAGNAVLSVEDDGIGIEPALLPSIFDLFSQAGSAPDSAHSGLGVGLALVRSLVELHGGTVSAQSEGRGRGSLFTVRLPLADEAPEWAAPRGSPSAAARATPTARIVIVVDDSADIAQSMALVLASWGLEPRTACDATTAIELCATLRPDVVILDIGLPGMNGYELAGRIRSIQPEVLLIALTGYGMTEDRIRAQAAGFDHHMTKPADLAALHKLLMPAR